MSGDAKFDMWCGSMGDMTILRRSASEVCQYSTMSALVQESSARPGEWPECLVEVDWSGDFAALVDFGIRRGDDGTPAPGLQPTLPAASISMMALSSSRMVDAMERVSSSWGRLVSMVRFIIGLVGRSVSSDVASTDEREGRLKPPEGVVLCLPLIRS